MADEQATEQVDTPTTENEVVITQSKLDALIDKGYSKGAKRAESELAKQLGVDDIAQARSLISDKREQDEANKSDLDKAAELIQTLNKTIEGLESDNKKAQADIVVQSIVADNGINDADYFKHLLSQASASEDFDQTVFIENLRGSKPYLFKGADIQPKRVDATSNRASLNVSDRVKGAKTMAELYQLQQEIT